MSSIPGRGSQPLPEEARWRKPGLFVAGAVVAVCAVAVVAGLAVGFDVTHLADMAVPVVLVGGIGIAAVILLAYLLPRMRSVRAKIATVSVVTVLTVAGGVATGATLMFFSAHDLRVLTVVLVVACAVGIVVAAVAAHTIARPLAAVEESFEGLASGDLDAHVDVDGRDETARLGTAFNSMAAAVAEMWEAERRNEQANRTLIASISHDLRTPIASLRAMVEALADGVIDDDETRDRYLIQLRRQTDDLSELVNDLFELNRVQAGAVDIAPAPTDLGEIAHACVDQFAVQAGAAGVELVCDAPESLPIVGGERELHRVLANLVQNALAHSPPGGCITIGVATDGSHVDITVRDEGPGIPPESLGDIFEPFYRGDSARTRAGGRAGLGLAIARSLVEAHGGTIWASNAADSGSPAARRHPPSTPHNGGAVVGFTIPARLTPQRGTRAGVFGEPNADPRNQDEHLQTSSDDQG